MCFQNRGTVGGGVAWKVGGGGQGGGGRAEVGAGEARQQGDERAARLAAAERRAKQGSERGRPGTRPKPGRLPHWG